MDQLDELIGTVRTEARSVVARAHAAMEAGAPIARVMDYYVSRTFDLEAEADAQAILASAGDPHALDRIEACLHQLEALSTELEAEWPAQE